MQELRETAMKVPGGEPTLDNARARARRAAEIVSAAVEVDPTLRDLDRCRDIDLCAEILRQLRPLARQAAQAIEYERLTSAGASMREFARLGRINPLALEELDVLSKRAVEIAQRVADAALPDWNTPTRIRERSERLLPAPRFIADLADQLRSAVQPAIELSHPAAAAVRLAALADQLRAAAGERLRCCAAPGCDHELQLAATGRPRIYCSPACRQRARRKAARGAAEQPA